MDATGEADQRTRPSTDQQDVEVWYCTATQSKEKDEIERADLLSADYQYYTCVGPKHVN